MSFRASLLGASLALSAAATDTGGVLSAKRRPDIDLIMDDHDVRPHVAQLGGVVELTEDSAIVILGSEAGGLVSRKAVVLCLRFDNDEDAALAASAYARTACVTNPQTAAYILHALTERALGIPSGQTTVRDHARQSLAYAMQHDAFRAAWEGAQALAARAAEDHQAADELATEMAAAEAAARAPQPNGVVGGASTETTKHPSESDQGDRPANPADSVAASGNGGG